MATTASAVINTTDTAAGTPTVPDASVTTKWQEYIWIRHLEATNTNKAKIYVWNPNATSDATYFKWQEVTAAVAFSDLTGAATIAQLPTGITVANLSIDGAITNTHLAGSVASDKLAGGITYGKITTVNASSVTSVNGSTIPIAAIPTSLTNTNIDSILGAASVDYDKLNIADGTIPGEKIKDSLAHDQIASVNATKITTGTLPPARLEYMFERNLPIVSISGTQSGTANLHTLLGSNAFEGIIRMVASASSNEVIIALPNPALSAYVGKAAKLSIYRGSSTGKVTIKVCSSGTNSSSFATNKIVDNNNGIITDQVIVMPQLTTAAARKVVVDLLCDSKASGTDNGDGQWIITGGAAVTGKGKVSVAGFRTGGGTNAPPEEGAQLDKVGLAGAAPDDGSPVVTKLNENESTGENVGIPVAKTARVQNYNSQDPGDNYTAGQKLTINMSGWTEEVELEVKEVNAETIYHYPNNRTKSIITENFVRNAADTAWLQGIYGGDLYKVASGSGQKPFKASLKYAASNSITTTTANPHAQYMFWLEGIQPLGNDNNPLPQGSKWYDPWTGSEQTAR